MILLMMDFTFLLFLVFDFLGRRRCEYVTTKLIIVPKLIKIKVHQLF